MSVYNGSQYLREAIESILAQTFRNFEFIIIDDASIDNSWEIIDDYGRQDQRVKLFKNEKNLGLTKSLNKGLRLARGLYIARQDADDISLSNRLERQVSILDSRPDVVLVSSDIEVVDAEGKSIRVEKRSCSAELVSWYLTFYNHIGGHSQVVFRRKTASELNGYSESCRYSQDYELWCRLDKVGQLYILPEVLHKLRRHGSGITAEKRADQLAYSFQQSRHNIKQLINRELSTEELSSLKQFWSGQLWNNFPDSKHAAHIHTLQKELYQAFVQRESSQPLGTKVDSQLRRLIGQQFITWVESLSAFRQISERIKISYFALYWHPAGLVLLWLIDYSSKPFSTLRLKLDRKRK